MKKTDVRLMMVSILFIIAVIISISVSQYTSERGKLFTTASKASESVEECTCDDQDICYPDGCTRKPKTPQNTYDDDRYSYVCDQNKPRWPPNNRVSTLLLFSTSAGLLRRHGPISGFEILLFYGTMALSPELL
ncbi:hypothetical protein IPM65_02835 [Candidatus Roizmanbacteria bacterium]|nr:MAG: hypothetical protein IPM65_02835 [Candidatus Roizmanbacteria bacterium]